MPKVRLFIAHYTLHNGAVGELPLLAANSFDAVQMVLDTFGEAVAKCKVRAS